jgi:ureidoacrylate peracid hydrolase
MDKHDVELRRSFLKSDLPGVMPEIILEPNKTAMLVIDMQYSSAHRDGKYGRWAREQGIHERLEYYFHRLEQVTVPCIRTLLEAARRVGLEVIFTRVASLTLDGREMGWRYKAWNMTDHLESHEAQILEEVRPVPGELVVTKTCTSVFLGSHLDRYLRNIGIKYLIVCGVATNGCVESAVRDASDLEYWIIVPEDACATLSQQDQDIAINAMHPLYAQVMSTEAIIGKIEREAAKLATVIP